MTSLFAEFRTTIDAALEASEAIMERYAREIEKVIKADGSPVTSADLVSSAIITKHLETTGIPVIGEESEKTEYKKRKDWGKVWCVDPLDGTKEFIKKNGEFVINIGLVENGIPVFGLIASPIRQEIIIGGKKWGAFQMTYEDALQPEKWKKIKPLLEPSLPIKMISSRSHYSGNFLKLVEQMQGKYGEIESKVMGSALKFFELVNGEFDFYPRLAPTMEWDIAAGQAIYEAVGGQVINVETGKPLVYNKESLKNPYFVAHNKKVDVSLNFYQS